MILHDYHRSSAAFRVRIALNLKGLTADHVAVPLLEGAQRVPGFLALNPQGLVPVLEVEGGALVQSLAIIEYLEEEYPRPPLLPKGAAERARVRSLALLVACDIHPLNNLRVLRHLTGPLGLSEEQKAAWIRHWITEGFAPLEARLAGEAGTDRYCHGRMPTLADVFLVPQVFNARRYGVDLEPFPTIRRIHDACMEIEAFASAAPEVSADEPQNPPPSRGRAG